MCEKIINYGDKNILGTKLCNIPNVSQQTFEILENQEYWRARSCAIACLKFGLNHYGKDIDTKEIPNIAKRDFTFFDIKSGEEKSYKYFSKDKGWNNYAILELAREKGLYGKVYNEKFDGVCDFLDFLQEFDNDSIFIVSVGFRGEIEDKIENGSHLVTVVGVYDNKIIVKNPYSIDNHMIYDLEEFVKELKGNIIVISDKVTDEFKSFSPIRFENDTLTQNNSNIITLEINKDFYISVNVEDIIEYTGIDIIKKFDFKLDVNEEDIFIEKISELQVYLSTKYEKIYFKTNL